MNLDFVHCLGVCQPLLSVLMLVQGAEFDLTPQNYLTLALAIATVHVTTDVTSRDT